MKVILEMYASCTLHLKKKCYKSVLCFPRKRKLLKIMFQSKKTTEKLNMPKDGQMHKKDNVMQIKEVDMA